MKTYPLFIIISITTACVQVQKPKISEVYPHSDEYLLTLQSKVSEDSVFEKPVNSSRALKDQIFTASVNGKAFIATDIRLVDVGPKYKIIIAKNHDIEGIRLNLWQIDKPGTYPLGNSPKIAKNNYHIYDNFGIERQNLTWTISENNSLNTSEITISELSDTIIEGTFNFEAINLINKLDSKIIENGRFKIILP